MGTQRPLDRDRHRPLRTKLSQSRQTNPRSDACDRMVARQAQRRCALIPLARRMPMKFAISFRSSIAMCALLLCSGAHAQTTPSQQIHVLTLLGRPVQLVVADKHGIFAKHGIESANDNKKNSDELRADLSAAKRDDASLTV